jgi:hypothetical protein
MDVCNTHTPNTFPNITKLRDCVHEYINRKNETKKHTGKQPILKRGPANPVDMEEN